MRAFPVIYVIGFVLMFGFAVDQFSKSCDKSECTDIAIGGGLIAGFFWPLVLSVEVFDRLDIPLASQPETVAPAALQDMEGEK